MGFILKEEEPFFFDAVDIDRDDNRAGVDFFRFIEVVELAGSLQFLDGNGSHIHQGLRFLALQVFPRRLIRFISALDWRCEGPVFKGNIRQFRHERRVAAVVRPVRIDDADFRDRRVAFFFIPEVSLDEFQIIEAHGQAHVRRQFLQGCVIHGIETFDGRNVCRFFPSHFQGRNRVERSFAGFDGVDAVMLDSSNIVCGQVARKDEDLRRADEAVVLHGQHLQALHGRIGALVILARQVFDGQDRIAVMDGQFIVNGINRRFGENHIFSRFKGRIVETGYVIAVVNVNICQPFDQQVFL